MVTPGESCRPKSPLSLHIVSRSTHNIEIFHEERRVCSARIVSELFGYLKY